MNHRAHQTREEDVFGSVKKWNIKPMYCCFILQSQCQVLGLYMVTDPLHLGFYMGNRRPSYRFPYGYQTPFMHIRFYMGIRRPSYRLLYGCQTPFIYASIWVLDSLHIGVFLGSAVTLHIGFYMSSDLSSFAF